MTDNLILFFGRLHPLVVHLPIGVVMLAIALQSLVRFKRFTGFRELLPLLWFAGFITSVMACLAGLMLKLSGGYDEEAVNFHQNMGIALAVVCGAVFIMQNKRYSQKILLPGVLLATFLLIGTGHYGGNLTHGEDYLTQPLYAIIGQAPGKKVRPPITNINEAIVYTDLVEPVLEQKCYPCHNDKKQKGDLRLDNPAAILKGGEHGKVLMAGKAEDSDIYKRLLLPEEDDDRMPPKGKPQLTESEIKLIHWWIENGGSDFKKKVADVEQDDKIKVVLASLTNGTGTGNTNTRVSEIPAVKVNKPDDSILKNLRSKGVVVSPLTKDNSYVAINMVNTPGFSDADMPLLAKLKAHVIWLDMSETSITDKSLKHLKEFKNLTRLSLDQTNVTDKGLVHLQGLARLKYLNLYGTKVTDQGLPTIEVFKELKSIYLWQTKVTMQGVTALQKKVGKDVEINFGTGSL